MSRARTSTFVAILLAVAAGSPWAQQAASFRPWSSLSLTRARELLPSRADVNKRDSEWSWTRLHYAAWNNDDPEVVRLLLDQGADLHALDEYGQTPFLMAALENENVEVFRLLLERGADPYAEDEYGNTALHNAAHANDNVEVLRFLLDMGAYVGTTTDDDGSTALHSAAGNNPNVEVVRFLLERIAVDVTDDHGSTPLHWAARWNENPKVLEVLLDYGARSERPEQRRQHPAPRVRFS